MDKLSDHDRIMALLQVGEVWLTSDDREWLRQRIAVLEADNDNWHETAARLMVDRDRLRAALEKFDPTDLEAENKRLRRSDYLLRQWARYGYSNAWHQEVIEHCPKECAALNPDKEGERMSKRKKQKCSHPNTAAASAIRGASVWCPDCKRWVRFDDADDSAEGRG